LFKKFILISIFKGFPVSVGKKTFIKTQKVAYYQLPYPFSECETDKFFEDDHKHFYKETNHSYKRTGCLEMCFHNILIKKCSCFDSRFVKDESLIEMNNLTACTTLKDIECSVHEYINFYNQYLVENCSLYCPEKCESIFFQTNSFSTDYLTRGYAADLIKSPIIYERFKNYTNLTYEVLKENILEVNIQLEELQYTMLTNQPIMDFYSLLTNLGGIMGLFVGFSFLTLIEFIQLFITIFFIFLKRIFLSFSN
jgi:hypothetical protein